MEWGGGGRRRERPSIKNLFHEKCGYFWCFPRTAPDIVLNILAPQTGKGLSFRFLLTKGGKSGRVDAGPPPTRSRDVAGQVQPEIRCSSVGKEKAAGLPGSSCCKAASREREPPPPPSRVRLHPGGFCQAGGKPFHPWNAVFMPSLGRLMTLLSCCNGEKDIYI